MAVIEKGNIQVRITTTRNIVIGYICKIESARTLDILNSRDKYIALTDATVYDSEHSEKHHEKFVALNTSNIVSVEEL